MNRVLYVIACAAPPAADVASLITLATERGWDTCVLTTPYGRRFVDVAALEDLTGHPVRSDFKNPGEPDVLPPADAIIVAPATVNTINKWAAGICDTLPLGILTEAIGKGLPVVAVPVSNQAHAAHPVFAQNLARLRSWGITVLDDALIAPGGEPHADDPGLDKGGDGAAADAGGAELDPAGLDPAGLDPAGLDRAGLDGTESGGAGLDWSAALAAVEAAGRRQATGATRRYEHRFRAAETEPGVGPGLASVHDIVSAPSARRNRVSGYTAQPPGGRRPGLRHSRPVSGPPGTWPPAPTSTAPAGLARDYPVLGRPSFARLTNFATQADHQVPARTQLT